MASEEQYDATRRRLQKSRQEVFELAHVLKGDRPLHPDPPGHAPGFPRSHIMRALTGERGRNVLGNAALALAMSRPKTVWRLAGLAPLLRPVILNYLAGRLVRQRKPTSPS
jgi:hypothetical protein